MVSQGITRRRYSQSDLPFLTFVDVSVVFHQTTFELKGFITNLTGEFNSTNMGQFVNFQICLVSESFSTKGTPIETCVVLKVKNHFLSALKKFKACFASVSILAFYVFQHGTLIVRVIIVISFNVQIQQVFSRKLLVTVLARDFVDIMVLHVTLQSQGTLKLFLTTITFQFFDLCMSYKLMIIKGGLCNEAFITFIAGELLKRTTFIVL